MKTIGLIGGMSWESSAGYYRLINQDMKQRLGGHRNARSVMVTVSFEEIKTLQHEARWDELGEHMKQAALQVQAAGADFVLLCTNTMHRVAPVLEGALDIPFLHIVDPTAKALQDAGVRRVGLLGTAFTMEQDFYRGRMQDRFGIEVVVPDIEGRALVHKVIYDELCHGIVRDASREAYKRIIDSMQAQGVEGVILGCTEIALLIAQKDVALPVFDTTALHAQAAVSRALA
ncbi:aspartate/glutamate racemase family protein [Paraburkholderia saeva]|uniref:L-aspartate/glutamate-specific racemase n=1 Tax=Paraburkholderia saeva TaxID=2777537 RepID=A0A9N8RV57_9BURK|nr:aspartate/glutamate racemase family protein [Paraburkholderia saeva]CAG4886855.1 L-aspartate/glutamate-specific racemase [Paraburkholderia saeva]CAG4894305.1 L-aspartate/glutamate-specific racemase [Paraburkholderia saeva]CAG4899068.1 L-aspartate/glutamate-specific racemase [Paraburkholderia saeva]